MFRLTFWLDHSCRNISQVWLSSHVHGASFHFVVIPVLVVVVGSLIFAATSIILACVEPSMDVHLWCYIMFTFLAFVICCSNRRLGILEVDTV